MKKIPGVLVVGALLSNCGGGGGGGSAVPAPVSGSPVLAQTKAQVSIKIPNSTASQLRAGKYIPANAASVRISVVAVNGAPPPAGLYPDIIQALNPSATGCSNSTGSLVCTINVLVPIASVTLAVSLYQSTDGSGVALATNTITTTIVSGVTPNVALTLGGVPSSISLGGPIVTAADGTTKTLKLPVTVQDASGATIIAPGTYSSPILFGISGDTNSALSAPPLTGPATSGQTVELITYNSAKSLTSATITAAIANGPTASTQINPLVYSPATATQMVVNGATVPIVVSEAGYAGAFGIAGAAPNTTTCVPANCTPTAAGNPVTINVSPANIANMATLAVTDAMHNVTANIPLGVASTSGGPSIPGDPTFSFDAITSGMTNPRLPVAGSDGNIWYAESSGSLTYPAWMSPTTGTPTSGASNFAVPVRVPFVALANITSDALGPDGDVWFVDNTHDQVDRVDHTGVISVNAANAALSVADVIAEGPDNQMWLFGTATGVPKIIEIAPGGNVAALTLSGSTLGTVTSMITGPDGNMWFTQQSPQDIGSITPAGMVTLYSPSLSGTLNAGLVVGPDGCLWFTEGGAGAWVGKIGPSCGGFNEFPDVNGAGGGITGIAEGGDGNLWYALPLIHSVGRITTGGTISHFSAGGTAAPSGMVLAPNGQMWFVDSTNARLGWLTY